METSARICVGLMSVAGVSTTVAVPVTLSVKSRQVRSLDNHPGGGVSQASLDLEVCKQEERGNRALLELDSFQGGNLCGKVKTSDKKFDNLEEYTDLLKERGGKGDKNGNQSTNQGKGTQQCYRGDSLKGAIFDSGSNGGIQHLGLCGDSPVEKTLFVKKVQKSGTSIKENERDGSLGICSSDCGDREAETFAGSTVSLTKEKVGSGEEVEFYNKEK